MTTQLAAPVAWLTLAAGGCALAGCGGSAGATVAAESPTTRAHATKTRAAVNVQATTYAQAINLRAADLPEMSVRSPARGGKAATPADGELARCAGEPNPDLVINRLSPTFATSVDGDNEEIHSNVEVMPSQLLAAQRNTAQFSPRGLACLKRFIPTALAKQSTTRLRYGPVTISRLPDPLPGVDGSFAIEITTTVVGVPSEIASSPPPVYIDALGFLSGAAEIDLTAVAFSQPVTPEVEQRLVSLLYSRSQAQKLY